MRRFGSMTICNLLDHDIRRGRHCQIAERDVGAGYIEISGEIIIYFLKACYSVVIFRP